MDIIQALELLQNTIESNFTHKDYDRTVELAKKYTALITGEGIDAYLRQFVRREDAQMFEQRKQLTKSITPAVCESIMNPFYKVARTNRVKSNIITKDNKAKQDITDAMAAFWGDGDQAGLDSYLQTRWIELSFSDPNAFIAVEFDPFDPAKEKAKPKPIEIPSSSAINYEYRNGVLMWLITKWSTRYSIGNGSMKDGDRYVMYLKDDAIELTEVDPKTRATSVENPQFLEINKGARVFVIQYYSPKSGRVPAVRVGYKRDMFTGGRTYVSPMHPAMAYFDKSIKTVSELDLSMSLHAFPQKYQYVTPCKGEVGKGCNSGKTRDGNTCKSCNGTGVNAVHTTAQDVVLLPMPKSKEDMMPLDQMAAYKTPDIDLLKFQHEYIQQLKADAIRAVFNGDTFVQSTVAKTATEKELDMDAVYDTLTPFAKRYSSIWISVVDLISVYTESAPKDLELFHKFPSDFKLKGLKQLLEELKLAGESSSPAYVIDSINDDLMEMMYADDQDELIKIKVKAKFYPFSGKSQEQVAILLTSDLAPRSSKILYSNFEEIFSQIELELGDEFYLLAEAKQREVIAAKVKAIEDAIAATAPRAMPIIPQA